MRKLLSFATLALGLAFAAPALSQDAAPKITILKSPQCGCCENYADYLTKNGFKVTVKPTHDLAALSRMAGITEEFQGCHLGMIDGYAVSGHVPVKTLKRMLSERPSIKGITLPGMPMGSPGMSGEKTEPFTVYEVGSGGKSGAPKVYAVE